jgi:hypothetical protein
MLLLLNLNAKVVVSSSSCVFLKQKQQPPLQKEGAHLRHQVDTWQVRQHANAHENDDNGKSNNSNNNKTEDMSVLSRHADIGHGAMSYI